MPIYEMPLLHTVELERFPSIQRVVSDVIDYFASRNYPLTIINISKEVRHRGFTDREIGSWPEQMLLLKGYVRQGYVKPEIEYISPNGLEITES